MIVSDEERRKVAKRLRSHDTMETPWLELGSCIGNTSDGVQDTFTALADLIDRPTCSIRCKMHKNQEGKTMFRPKCSNCGQVFIVAGFFNEAADPVGFRYCPNCGAEVV